MKAAWDSEPPAGEKEWIKDLMLSVTTLRTERDASRAGQTGTAGGTEVHLFLQHLNVFK